MTEEERNEDDLRALVDQYRFYTRSADGVSDRRSKTNAYYVSVTGGVLVLAAKLGDGVVPESRSQALGLILIGIVGILVCLIWAANVSSFRKLNTAKFKVLHEMEQRLPFPCYDREWQLLGRGADRKKYFQLTRVEQILPLALTIPYVLLIAVAIVHWV